MADTLIVGAGQIPVGEHWELSLRQMAARAALDAMHEAPGITPQAIYVGNFLSPVLSHQANLGALLAQDMSLEGVEAFTAEAAEASGSAALHLAHMALQSGYVDSALVVGVEKITDQIGSRVTSAVAQGLDEDYEGENGLTPAGQAALIMRQYLLSYGLEGDVLAAFPMLAHENAQGNLNAIYRRPIAREDYLASRLVSDPLRLYDCAPYADGAAALLLVRSDRLNARLDHPRVRVLSSEVATDRLALHDRADVLNFEAAEESTRLAFERAALAREEVDFFELWDEYSVYAALALEAAGYAGKGEGWRLARDGLLGRNGQLPIATMGGLKARGHPLGASGIYQAVEATLQLRGEAGGCQVAGARRGLVQSFGGPAATVVTHILERT